MVDPRPTVPPSVVILLATDHCRQTTRSPILWSVLLGGESEFLIFPLWLITIMSLTKGVKMLDRVVK